MDRMVNAIGIVNAIDRIDEIVDDALDAMIDYAMDWMLGDALDGIVGDAIEGIAEDTINQLQVQALGIVMLNPAPVSLYSCFKSHIHPIRKIT